MMMRNNPLIGEVSNGFQSLFEWKVNGDISDLEEMRRKSLILHYMEIHMNEDCEEDTSPSDQYTNLWNIIQRCCPCAF